MQRFDRIEAYSASFSRTGDLSADISRFLIQFDRPQTAVHCQEVAAEAKRLATLFGGDSQKAETAALLHDISVIIPNKERAAFARTHNIPLLAEEVAFPMIIHQKLSVLFAETVFGIDDTAVLSAIGCHTTLKSGATLLDKIVFLADKIAWDQAGDPPYIEEMTAALEQSLDTAVMVYLTYLWDQRAHLRVIHPWFVIARAELLAISDG